MVDSCDRPIGGAVESFGETPQTVNSIALGTGWRDGLILELGKLASIGCTPVMTLKRHEKCFNGLKTKALT